MFLLFLQIVVGVVALGFCAIVISAVALTIRQAWTKQPELPKE